MILSSPPVYNGSRRLPAYAASCREGWHWHHSSLFRFGKAKEVCLWHSLHWSNAPQRPSTRSPASEISLKDQRTGSLLVGTSGFFREGIDVVNVWHLSFPVVTLLPLVEAIVQYYSFASLRAGPSCQRPLPTKVDPPPRSPTKRSPCTLMIAEKAVSSLSNLCVSCQKPALLKKRVALQATVITHTNVRRLCCKNNGYKPADDRGVYEVDIGKEAKKGDPHR
jgi:hypothetical protein